MNDKQSESARTSLFAYQSNLALVNEVCPEIAQAIVQELNDQRNNLKLIASENYSSYAVQAAMGNLLTDKYAEGYVGKRFYSGCENIDTIEEHARRGACRLFGADLPGDHAAVHAYVQPHSGADANLVAYCAILNARVRQPALDNLKLSPGQLPRLDANQWRQIRSEMGNQRLLGMDLAAGGHLTHGYRLNISAYLFESYSYGVDPDTFLLNYDEIERLAQEIRPLILLAGYSAYPRLIDFERMRAIAERCGAVLMVDMAHFAGLVAGGVFTGKHNPIPYADIVTSTTHKTLRGPRGGIVLCRSELKEFVDKGCPNILGGPLPHVMAAKAVCFAEAIRPQFKTYAHRIVANAKALAQQLSDRGLNVVTGGTDNHLVLVNVADSEYHLAGRQADAALRECGVTMNKNTIPFDKRGPIVTSGLRLGTPAVTTLGMQEAEMVEIAEIIADILAGTRPDGESTEAYILAPSVKAAAEERVQALLRRFPLYPDLSGNLLESAKL